MRLDGANEQARTCRCRTANWSGRNVSLRKRGSLLIWLDKEMAWLAPQEGRPGRPRVFSNAAVRFCLPIKVLFKPPLRQGEPVKAPLVRARWRTGACRVLWQHRFTQWHIPAGPADEDRLVADMIEPARQLGRYGYRRIAALLREAGWPVNDDRVERLWRREGLKVPAKQPKKGRLWLNEGSCVRLRPEYRNHVWSYGFAHCRTEFEGSGNDPGDHFP